MPAQPVSTTEEPDYFDRYTDIELPKLFSGVRVDGEPRKIVRPLEAHERASLRVRATELQAALRPYQDRERPIVMAQIAAMLGGYRSLRQSGEDVEAIVSSTAAVLAPFPFWAIAKGCLKIVRREAGLDPHWPPNDSEIYAVVDGVVRSYSKALASAKALLAAPVEEKRQTPRPTLVELKAKHGPNWGIKGEDGEEAAAARRRRMEALQRANRIAFERECVKAGWPKDSPISPSLAKLIREQRERDE